MGLEVIAIYKVKDVAKIFYVCERTVYRMIKSGELKAVRFGKSWRIAPEEVERYKRNKL